MYDVKLTGNEIDLLMSLYSVALKYKLPEVLSRKREYLNLIGMLLDERSVQDKKQMLLLMGTR